MGETIDGKMLFDLGKYASINDKGDVVFPGISSDGS
jgi:hypothetical protein